MDKRPQAGRQKLIVSHHDPDYSARVSKQFRQLGWDVHSAESEADVRRLARSIAPAVVILATDFPGESGWLTCAKLTSERPGLKVILVGHGLTPDQVRFGTFAGSSALVELEHGMRGLVEEVYRVVDLPMVG